MGSVAKSHIKDVMLDIDSELAYWRLHYTQSPFHRTQRAFDDYVPTLKFGYDMYLLNHGCDLEHMLPALRSRYQATAMGRDPLDWPLAEAVIREAWKRMHPGTDRKCVRSILPSRTSRPANWSQPQYQTA